MGNTAGHQTSPHDVFRLLKQYPKRWLVPMAGVAVLGIIYALVRPDTWEASQALYIREQATADHHRPGNFVDILDMKTVQETIFELAKSNRVLTAALKEVGPPEDCAQPAKWPAAEDVEDLRDALEMTPPGGAEFGKTEVFYLKVESDDRERAIALTSTICSELQGRFAELREEKYQSMIAELERAESVAEGHLHDATARLAELEQSVGVDLAELRMLHASHSAGTDLRQTLVEVHNEIRRFETDKRQSEQLLALLRSAQKDPGHLLATPNSLLDSQPALRRLKEGLIDAQLETARLAGRLSPEHPQRVAAEHAAAEISRHLHEELALSIRGLEVELQLDNDRIEKLQGRLEADGARLDRLAGLRAEYGNLVAEVQNRTNVLETARANLAEALANQASARTVSLLLPIDEPDTGTDPVGPSRAAIGLIGTFGGFITGLGCLLLTTNPSRPLCDTDWRWSSAIEAALPARGRGEEDFSADDGLSFSRSEGRQACS